MKCGKHYFFFFDRHKHAHSLCKDVNKTSRTEQTTIKIGGNLHASAQFAQQQFCLPLSMPRARCIATPGWGNHHNHHLYFIC